MEANKISNGVREKILVIDDEEHIVELLRYNLQKEGFKVYGAFEGEEALSLASRLNPDLIILDLMLPGLDGYEVLWLLKKNRQLAHIPVVILSARTLKEDLYKGRQLGADGYIVKPFSVAELVIRIKEVLKKRGRTQALPDRIGPRMAGLKP